jgi:alkylation response protein AidB-like acyl-CoA dehydrogenase
MSERPEAVDHQREGSRCLHPAGHGRSHSGVQGHHGVHRREEFPGFTVGKKEDKLGIRASSTCELILEDCRVPKENVLGEVGKGYKIAIETLNEGRIGIGAQMLGLARGAWEFAAKYAQERKQFGRAIAEFQGIQFQIAQMATEIEAARMLLYNCARMKDAGMNFVKEAAMTKLYCSQIAERVASLCVEIYGGYGFTKDYPVEKFFRDSKIGKIYEGTSNMQLQTIANMLAIARISAYRSLIRTANSSRNGRASATPTVC